MMVFGLNIDCRLTGCTGTKNKLYCFNEFFKYTITVVTQKTSGWLTLKKIKVKKIDKNKHYG